MRILSSRRPRSVIVPGEHLVLVLIPVLGLVQYEPYVCCTPNFLHNFRNLDLIYFLHSNLMDTTFYRFVCISSTKTRLDTFESR
jgi:hypothetical protein